VLRQINRNCQLLTALKVEVITSLCISSPERSRANHVGAPGRFVDVCGRLWMCASRPLSAPAGITNSNDVVTFGYLWIHAVHKKILLL
jgi:hypothetical protein